MTAMLRFVVVLLLFAGLVACSDSGDSERDGPVEAIATLVIETTGLPEGASDPTFSLAIGDGHEPVQAGVPVSVPAGTYTVTASSLRHTFANGNWSRFMPESASRSVTLEPNETTRITVPYRLEGGTITVHFVDVPSGAEPIARILHPDGRVLQVPGGDTVRLPSWFRYAITVVDVVVGEATYVAEPSFVDFDVSDGDATTVTIHLSPKGQGWHEVAPLWAESAFPTKAFPQNDGTYLIANGSLRRVDLRNRTVEALDSDRGDSVVQLQDGRIMTTGGYDHRGAGRYLATVRTFDPETREKETLAPISKPRPEHSATVLPDGNVLLVGGTTADDPLTAVRSIEVYDPLSGASVVHEDALAIGRAGSSAFSLDDGRVVIFGGYSELFVTNDLVEVYDASTGAVSTLAEINPGGAVSGTILDNVLYIAGGGQIQGVNLETGAIVGSRIAQVTSAPVSPAISPLGDGRLLISGGGLSLGGYDHVTGTDIFDPESGTVTPGPPLANARRSHAQLQIGESLFVVGGMLRTSPDPEDDTTPIEQLGLPLGP